LYPAQTNKILESFLKAKGVAAEDIRSIYTPFPVSIPNWPTIGRDQRARFGGQKRRGRPQC